MIKMYLTKKRKIVRGMINTYLQRKGQKYTDKMWWDESFYKDGISDRQTISQTTSIVSAMYHYASVELIILRYLFNNNIPVNQSTILDIGSGAGHWIDFYKSLGSRKTIGLDVSLSSVNYLKEKYSGQQDVTIEYGKASEVISKLYIDFGLVNAIGVMFHIVDDAEWIDTINKIAKSLQSGGLFIVGGHFGLLNGLNVQIDANGQINKRLRSKRAWKSALKQAGFSRLHFFQNNAYLWFNKPLPESNLLVARK